MFHGIFIDAIPDTAVAGIYKPSLVLLSYVVAAFGAYTGLSLAAEYITAETRRQKALMLTGGATAMGCAIWSMHFIGMLAYKMEMPMTYDTALTALSMVIAVTIAFSFFAIATARPLRISRQLAGAALLGTAICCMHYTGMAAMQMKYMHLYYLPGTFALSVAVSLAAAMVALWVFAQLEKYPRGGRKTALTAVAGLVLGAGICGMHYTGMAAAIFVPEGDMCLTPVPLLDDADNNQQALFIAAVTGGIAHDLNNILSPILMSITLLKSRAKDKETLEILSTIDVSARRGAEIVRQVLSFARGMDGQRIPVNADEAVGDIESFVKDTFPKNITLHASVAPGTSSVNGDPTQLHQLLLNLCVNARDAMPQGGTLKVTAENAVIDEHYAAMHIEAKPGSFVVFSVTDTGTGIPQTVIDKIFDPFFTTKEFGKGTGLGLSTVAAVAKSHGGFTHVYSEEGRGTTFRVYLPALKSVAPPALAAQPDNLPRGNGEKILVVDDEASILTITGQTLKAFGYSVLTAADGAEAVALYARHMGEIDVVLTDMMMPVMDGPATIVALRRLNPNVRIIAASGLESNGKSAQASADVRHFLKKPYTAESLLATLKSVLSD